MLETLGMVSRIDRYTEQLLSHLLDDVAETWVHAHAGNDFWKVSC